ncbi:MAG: hypothetical protein IPI72_05755 [Flavobacteriales bacterium]|nr:hypothetical protein [Flavobacteriales bacterium]MBK8707873.1 hypothetical protein [Flavobacteriales bacterium]
MQYHQATLLLFAFGGNGVDGIQTWCETLYRIISTAARDGAGLHHRPVHTMVRAAMDPAVGANEQ